MKKTLGVLFAAVLIFSSSSPASAEERTVEERLKALEEKSATWSPSLGAWSFYGSARFMTFYEESSKKFADVKTLTDLSPAADNKTTAWGMQNNSRLGASVSKGNLGGKIELGFNPDGRGSNSNVYTRLLYGTYSSEGMVFLVGQDYTPLDFTAFSNQVFGSDNDLYYYGNPYESRQPQVKLTWKGFQAALVKPGSADVAPGTAANRKTEVLLPRLDLRYSANLGAFKGDVFGGASTYKVKSTSGASINKNVESYLAGLNGSVTVSPVYANAMVWSGQNIKQMGFSQANTIGAQINSSGEVHNSQDFGWAAVAGGNIGKCTVEAGYGYVVSKNSLYTLPDTARARSYYLQTVIPVVAINGAKFSITPEIGVIDNMNDASGAPKGSAKYAGAQWRLDF